MSDAAYRLEDVTVRFGERVALHVSSLEIARGRSTALAGPNGAGKTTLLRVLALLLPPTAGRLLVDGRPLPDRERERLALRRSVTLVAQSPLLLRRSVRENVAYGLAARGLRARARVDEALAAVRLERFADRPAWKLSGGEAQRVALARALALDTPTVLFDEPTANVDREHVARVEAAIDGLRRAGKTIVVASHDLDQAWRLCDAVIALARGRIVPAPLVNLVRGLVVRSGEDAFLEAPGVRIELPAGRTPSSGRALVSIAPEEIVVSAEPLRSSARNALAGRVARAVHDERGVVLTVDCGQPLVARITPHSWREMRLDVGAVVWLTFKSSAIHVLEDPG